MKNIATALLLANASAKQAQYTIDTDKMVKITEGILMGTLKAEGFDDI
jgi:hypothetical protein